MKNLFFLVTTLSLSFSCFAGKAAPINYDDLINNSTHILIAKVVDTANHKQGTCGKTSTSRSYTATLQVISEIKGKDKTGSFKLDVCHGQYAFNSPLSKGFTYVLFLKKSGSGYVRTHSNRSVAKF